MKKSLIGLIFILLCWSCGERVVDPEDNTDSLLLGMWDSVSNNTTSCHERLRLNSDKTFWWFDKGATYAGTYGRNDKELNMMYTNKPWEMIQFQVTDRQLYLTRTGATRMYTRVPLTANSSPCPAEGKAQ